MENFQKLTNSFLHTSNSCQIAITLICNMAAFLVQWQSRTTVKQRKRRKETESGGEIERLGRNPVCLRAPPLCLGIFVGYRWNVPNSWTIVNRFNIKFKKCWLTSPTWLQLVLIGWQLPTHVGHPFTRQMRVYQHEKVGEKLARIDRSSICRQQFVNLFADCFCVVHTHQLEFANTSLPTQVCQLKFVVWRPLYSAGMMPIATNG